LNEIGRIASPVTLNCSGESRNLGDIMKTFFILVSVLAVLFIAAPNSVTAQKAKAGRTIDGKLSEFICGHVCYLTISDKKGKKHTGICDAPLCNAWWAKEGTIPTKYKGKRVRVTVVKEKILLDEENAKAFTSDVFIKIQLLK
jgi:hypothetical protein